jgi:hypothetical protein
MSTSFGQVIGIPQMNLGFLGDITRVGGGDPFVVSRQANAANVANINVGDAVVLMPDATGGTVKQFADWLATGGGFTIATATASASATLTPAAASNLNGLSIGMFVQGPGIPAGSYITAVNFQAGTITISKNATATAGAAVLYYANFYGIAVRETKTNQPFSSYSPTSPGQILPYVPGELVDTILRGGVLVQNKSGAQPVSGGPAYIRAILNVGTFPNAVVGGIEPIADTVNNVLLDPFIAEAFFKLGYQDSNNLVEMTILTRLSA